MFGPLGQLMFGSGHHNRLHRAIFPESAYAEAGYEVDTAFYHYGLDLPVAPGIGEQLVKELMELIKE